MDKKRVIAIIVLTILGAALLIYTATRTLHLIEATLPADQKTLAWFALAAFDIGLPLWVAYALWGARGPWQRGVASIMVFISLLGVIIAFGGDTLIGTTERGLASVADAATITWIVYGTIGVIALNVSAITVCHMTEPAALKEAAEEDARDKIYIAELKAIRENADGLAADIAPVRAASWREQMQRSLLADLPQELADQFRAEQAKRMAERGRAAAGWSIAPPAPLPAPAQSAPVFASDARGMPRFAVGAPPVDVRGDDDAEKA